MRGGRFGCGVCRSVFPTVNVDDACALDGLVQGVRPGPGMACTWIRADDLRLYVLCAKMLHQAGHADEDGAGIA